MQIISVLSIIISAYLTYLHYSDTSSFCNFSEGLSCDVVNKSIYSEFPPGSGIPVSLMGIITFLIVLLVLYYIKNDKEIYFGRKKIGRRELSEFLFYLMILSLIFALYLVYTEAFLILSFCVLCLVLDIFIILVLVLSYKLRGEING